MHQSKPECSKLSLNFEFSFLVFFKNFFLATARHELLIVELLDFH